MSKEQKDPELKFTIKQTKDFISAIIGNEKEETQKKQEKDGKAIVTLISLLTNKEDPQIKLDALKELKTEAAKEILLKAIAVTEDIRIRQVLVAACWEAGLDFSRYVSFFVQLAIISDLQVCLDALTIIEDMQGPFDNTVLLDCIKKLEEAKNKADDKKSVFLSDIIDNLSRHLTN